MNDYKPNSHRFKEEQKREVSTHEKRATAVISGGAAKTREKSGLTKVAQTFISDDIKNVRSYLVMDVIVPTIKKSIITIIDMALNGGTPSYTNRGSGSKVSYRKYYDDPRDDRRSSERNRTRFDYDVIEFESRPDAEAVLDEMHNVLHEYKIVRVADLYDIADLSAPFTSNRFGWTSLRDARVVRSGGKYIIDLPKAMPID